MQYTLALGLAAIATVTVTVGTHLRTKDTETAKPVTGVSTESPGPIYAVGRIEGVTEEISLRPSNAGVVSRLPVAEGDRVEKGDLLLQTDDATFRHARDVAAAKLELARAKLARLENGAHQREREEARAVYQAALAKLEREKQAWKRTQQLDEVIMAAERETQRAATLVAVAEANAAKARLALLDSPTREDDIRIAVSEMEIAASQLALAEERLERQSLRAPVSGTILEISCQPGEYVSPESEEPTIVIVNQQRLRVRAYVEELDAPRVQIGTSAVATVDGLADERFVGRVTSLSPHMVDKTLFSNRPDELHDTSIREVLVDLEPPTAGLIVGLRADVMIRDEPLADIARPSQSDQGNHQPGGDQND